MAVEAARERRNASGSAGGFLSEVRPHMAARHAGRSRSGGRLYHDGAGYEDGASIATLDADKTKYAASPVLLMVRDPRDVVVSGYFQVTRRLRLQSAASISMSDFIRDAHYGIEKTARFNLQWFAAARALPDFAILLYEDLHRNTGLALSAVVRFGGHDASVGAPVRDVVARRSFTQMRTLEAAGAFASRYGDALTPADPADANPIRSGGELSAGMPIIFRKTILRIATEF